MQVDGAGSPMTQHPPQLSVVIPSYNSAPWLPSTLAALAEAVERAAPLVVQVVIVDDGSTDDTPDVVASAAVGFPGTIELVRQANGGRFLAREAGLRRAEAPLVLLLDSRVLLAEDALRYVFARMADDPSTSAWNGHVHTDPTAPLVGFFWDVPTYIFWGHYLRSPRPYVLDDETFDTAPKGTGMFLARREVLEDAFEHARPQGDARLVSDDTKVLRRIAHTSTILLDPGFAATYRPRTTARGFVAHTFDRGTLFVDSYAGTSIARSALLFVLPALPVVAIVVLLWLALAGAGPIALAVIAAGLLLLAAPVIPAAVNRCPPRGLFAYLACLPLFVGPFWLGLVRGLVIHRRAFLPQGARQARTSGKETP